MGAKTYSYVILKHNQGGQFASLSGGLSVKFEVGERMKGPCAIYVEDAYRCSLKDTRESFEAWVAYLRPAVGSELPKSSEENALLLLVKKGTPSMLFVTLWRYQFCCFRSVFGNV